MPCTCISKCLTCVVRCLACIFCDVLRCECNCIIFPAPNSYYQLDQNQRFDGGVYWQYSSFNSEGRKVPYLKISTPASKKSKRCFIYFHGNAEDIGYVGDFLKNIVKQTNITFYAIEYPSYGQYRSLSGALISDTIKQDALNFYNYLLTIEDNERTVNDIFVMGRSIGSGGASYLSGNKPVPLLILMSPFDTIKKVAQGMLGCLAGCCVRQHFDNQQQIKKFDGKLLIIHGQNDEVIRVGHGKNLINVYENKNSYTCSATKVYPMRMTHNNFNMQKDIVTPISNFMKGMINQ